jgi:glycine/D-amino acid oxidase-like deaminating enzyme
LAGACLALQLLLEGRSFVLFDQPSANRSTAIAAGLFNPITSKVMTKTWMADRLFDSLFAFYSRAVQQTGVDFFHPSPVYRPFVSVEEQNEWMARSSEPAMQRYVLDIATASRYGQVNDPHGGLLLNRCGYLDTRLFMEAIRGLASRSNCYVEAPFVYQDLQLGPTLVYRDWAARFVVFCEGTATRYNPWFSWLPVQPLKGETLEVTTPEPLELIYNRGVYVVPSAEGRYRVGATYQRSAAEGCTPAGRAELEDKLATLLRLPCQVLSQDWGHRPTVPDRKPILGAHPDHPNLVVFNGLGTKGVSLAPHFSGVLARWLAGTGQIEKDVNISRFYALYSKF